MTHTQKEHLRFLAVKVIGTKEAYWQSLRDLEDYLDFEVDDDDISEFEDVEKLTQYLEKLLLSVEQ